MENTPFFLGRFWPILRGKLAVRFREGSYLGFGGARCQDGRLEEEAQSRRRATWHGESS